MEATVLDHPLCDHKLTLLRDVKTPGSLFRKVIEELGLILAVEAHPAPATEPVAVETPLERTQGRRLTSLDPVLVPVLGPGWACCRPSCSSCPRPRWATSGLYRDHDSLVPVPYYRNFPPLLEERSCSCWTPCSPPAAAPRRRSAS